MFIFKEMFFLYKYLSLAALIKAFVRFRQYCSEITRGALFREFRSSNVKCFCDGNQES